MKSLSVQIRQEFSHINKVRTFGLLGVVLMLMLSPLFINASQQLQDFRQRADTTQNAITATQSAQHATDSATTIDSSTSANDAPVYDAPYYPDISPWVFIVPGVIMLLAIFFH